MPALAIRQTTWAGATAKQKAMMRLAMERLDLGDPDEGIPPVCAAPGGLAYYIWDDPRISLRDLAILGCLAFRIAGVAIVQLPITRQKVMNFISSTVVWPSEIDYTNVTNPFQHTLDAQGAPAWIKAIDDVPASWVRSADG